ncbi:type II toxin-antitoxin system VapC family toxin [Anaerophaga thermohalophila]|jgi:hypothetical protein|uniref:type II toxin-antitoxin system VapC family toxin n=1 Tax=Anaerophaga thermohalophila TaxID=177400 RepID=UPI0002DDA901|nr:type II toxin-antitoxin system VapC family toxin [Anaerophaga thermohalophila]
MNGNSILVDTNIVISLTNGYEDILPILRNKIVYLSIISEMELLSWPKINNSEIKVLKNMLKEFNIIELNQRIKEKAIFIRRNYSSKLPDAIIAATSICYDLPLVTYDKGFSKISQLDLLLLNFDA